MLYLVKIAFRTVKYLFLYKNQKFLALLNIYCLADARRKMKLNKYHDVGCCIDLHFLTVICNANEIID